MRQFYCHDLDQNGPPQMISLGFSSLELIFTVSSCIPTWILISSLSSRCLWFHSLSWGSLSDLCVASVHDLGPGTTCWTFYHWFLSPKKQPTFGDATAAWFPREMRSEELAQKFPSDDVLLSWDGQCFWLVENLLQPIKKEHYPDLDSNVSSYGFCPSSSDLILRENRRCNREMPAVFSGLICFLTLLCLY